MQYLGDVQRLFFCLLRDLLVTGEPTGDLTSLENPDASDVVKAKLREPV